MIDKPLEQTAVWRWVFYHALFSTTFLGTSVNQKRGVDADRGSCEASADWQMLMCKLILGVAPPPYEPPSVSLLKVCVCVRVFFLLLSSHISQQLSYKEMS